MIVLAGLLAGAAVALLLPGRCPLRRGAPGARLRRIRPGAGVAVTVAVSAAALTTVFDGTRLMFTLVVLGAVVEAAVLVRRSRAAAAARLRQALVVEVCETLVGELRAGTPPAASLERCLDVWPELEPVVASSRLGADVPAALRRLARAPGAEGLVEIASAWQVSQRTGAGLALSLAQVAATARARQGTRRLVQGELSSAQATARLVAVLPVASLAMSAGIGGDPWHFLLATPAGVGCLGLGALFAFVGLWWIDRIAVAVMRA